MDHDVPAPVKRDKTKLSDRIALWLEKENKRNKRIKNVIEFLVKSWPIGIGVVFSLVPTVATNTNRFLGIAINEFAKITEYRVDYVSISVWILSFLWLYCDKIYDSIKKLDEDKLRAEGLAEGDKQSQKIIKGYQERFEGVAASLESVTKNTESQTKKIIEGYEKKFEEVTKDFENASNKINAAIHNAPNPRIFIESKPILQKIYDDLQTLKVALESGSPGKDLKEFYEKIFAGILIHICDLTRSFSNNKYKNYTANIMLYIPSVPEMKPDIDKILSIEENCIYFKNVPAEKVLGVLHAAQELRVFIGDQRNLPPVTLPFIEQEPGAGMLPGAPQAVIEGVAVINTTEIDKDKVFADMPNEIKEEAKAYFSSDAGRHIKSIVSIKIPVSGATIGDLETKGLPTFQGVINVDCDQCSLLGEDEKYFATYYAIVQPIIFLLAPFVLDYYHFSYPSKN